MTLPLTPATPFTAFTSVITSAFLNAVRTGLNQALDGTGGSTPGLPYTPSNPLAVHGAGMNIDPLNGAVRSTGTGTFSTTVASGSNGVNVSTFTGSGILHVASASAFPPAGMIWLSSQGALIAYSGTTTTTFTGCLLLSVESGASTLSTGEGVVAGNSLFLDAAAVEVVMGQINLDGTGGNGSLVVTGGGTIDILQGTISLAASTTMQLQPGASLKVGGTNVTAALLEVQDFGILQVDNGGTVSGASGSPGALLLWAGAATFSGTLAMTGAMTRSGSLTKSGSGGWTADRPGSVNNSPSGATIADATQEDVWVCSTCSVDNGSVFVTRTVTVTDPPAGTQIGIRTRLAVPVGTNVGSGNTHAYLVVTTGTATEQGNAAVDSGSGNLTQGAFVDLMVTQTSGTGRTWTPIGRS